MAIIDFKQIAAPNFNDSNTLALAAAESGNTALTGLQGVFKDAMGAVQNRNHADMQTIINQQTPETLNDPKAVAALMEQFNGMAAATGNNWDPTVVGAALDGRQDTLLNRGGKRIGNAQAGIDMQAATQDMIQTGVVNKQTNAAAEATAEAARKEKQIIELSQLMEFDKSATFDLTTPEGKAAAEKHRKEMDDAILTMFPDGIDIQDAAAQFAYGSEQNETAYERSLKQEAAEVNINNAKDANKRGNIGLAWKMEQGEAKTNQSQVKQVRDQAALNGISPMVFKEDGTFNAPAANQDLASKVDNAVRELRNPTDSVPFADRVLEYMKTDDDKRVLNNKQLGQAQKALTNYALQNKSGKALKLNDDERWAVIQAMATGELQSDSLGTGDFVGFSNYEGLYEEVVPRFVNRLRQQTQPINENNAIAAVYSDYFKGIGSMTDAVAVRDAMGIGPEDPRNKYMPPSLRHPKYKGEVYTDKPAYVDKELEAKRAAGDIENSGKQVKPSKAKGGTQRSVYDLRNNY